LENLTQSIAKACHRIDNSVQLISQNGDKEQKQATTLYRDPIHENPQQLHGNQESQSVNKTTRTQDTNANSLKVAKKAVKETQPQLIGHPRGKPSQTTRNSQIKETKTTTRRIEKEMGKKQELPKTPKIPPRKTFTLIHRNAYGFKACSSEWGSDNRVAFANDDSRRSAPKRGNACK